MDGLATWPDFEDGWEFAMTHDADPFFPQFLVLLAPELLFRDFFPTQYILASTQRICMSLDESRLHHQNRSESPGSTQELACTAIERTFGDSMVVHERFVTGVHPANTNAVRLASSLEK
jgi:hypothetical protein